MGQLFSLFCLDKKFLIFNLVMRNLKIKYRESFLGYLWTMAIPASQISIFYFLYIIVFKVTMPYYLVFLVSGLLPWLFFSTTISESMESISANAYLLNQMPIPIQVFPNTSSITNMINLLAAFPMAVIVYLTSGLALHWSLVCIFPLFILLYLLALSIGVIFSVVYVYFKDLRHVTGLIMQVWFYGTPIVYGIDMVPQKYQSLIISLNPVAGFFILFRNIIFDQPMHYDSLIALIAWTLFSIAVAFLTLNKFGQGVIEKL